ncbi:hypothetical protein BH10CYA1_BH10CYA1_14320 [soil metagenome]
MVEEAAAVERGHKVVDTSERSVSRASEAINKEIGSHLGNPTYNKEFLQTASADLQTKGLLPEMAVNFGIKYFDKLDTNQGKPSVMYGPSNTDKGYLTEAEVRRGLLDHKAEFTPAELIAGNYLADRLAESKSSMGTSEEGRATVGELNKFKADRATKFEDYANAQLVHRALGNEKDFGLVDTDKNGFLSTEELHAKLTDNERRLAYDKVDPAVKQKLEEENKALNFITSGNHKYDISSGKDDTWSSDDLSLGDIRGYSNSKLNPGQVEARSRVTDDMVRTTPKAESEAKIKEDAAAAAKVIADKAAADAKVIADKTAAEAKIIADAKAVKDRADADAKTLADAKAIQERAAKAAADKAEKEAANETPFDKYVKANLPYTEKNVDKALDAAAKDGKPIVFVVASQKSPDMVTAAAQANMDGKSVVVFLDPSKLDKNSSWGKYAQQLIDTHNTTSGTNDQSATAVFGTYKDSQGKPIIREHSGSFMDKERPLHEYNAGLRELIKSHGPVYAATEQSPQLAERPVQYEQPPVQYEQPPVQYQQPVRYEQQVQHPVYQQQRRGLFHRR